MSIQQRERLIKIILFILFSIPAIVLTIGLFTERLGVNPVETLTHETGEWGLRLLLLTLFITPLRQLTGWVMLTRLRRMIGLFAFFYVVLHFSTWLVLDHFFDWRFIVEDILERPYITVGFTALVLMVPLAVTSTNKMIRRLGPKRWQKLHYLAYPAAIGGVVHFWWLVKSDFTEPLVYAVILSLLFAARGYFKLVK
ncbi:MAG: protein-methionine-sulfoxide reductase heme-binding subunit MsrQ [Pseudomonadota bacterium]